MRGNDLDNILIPRDLVVYEGLLGLIPSERVSGQLSKFLKRGKWERAVACFETNEMLSRKIMDVTFRYSYELDVVTYIGGEEFAKALEERIHDRDQLPVKDVRFEDPYMLARRLAFEPAVRFIYDPEPTRLFAYGSRGRLMMSGDYNNLGQ